MSDHSFHSPYQFIPVTGTLRRDGQEPAPVQTTGWDLSKDGRTAVSHEYWRGDTYSGRLLCRLKTVSPTLVGAEQRAQAEGQPETIANYRIGGRLAIPGSSLRGAIGAVAEALSQSAMRVLPQRRFNVRKAMHESLQGIGVLRRDGEEWRLLPLAVTSLLVDAKVKGAAKGPDTASLPEKWQQVCPPPLTLAECLAAYFGDYRKPDPQQRPDRFECFHARKDSPYLYSAEAYAPALAVSTSTPVKLHANSPLSRNHGIAVRGHLSDLSPDPDRVTTDVQRGVVYVLDRRSKGDPMTKKFYEWFLPFSEDWETRLANARGDDQSTLHVPWRVIDDFETIAAERWYDSNDAGSTEDRLPFLPKGYGPRSPRRNGGGGFLRDGDLVYFNVDDAGQKATEVAFSSIWRAWVPGDLHGAFRRTAGKDSLPWNPDRDGLTPAEYLFGVVEEMPEGKAPRRPSRNLASRVRFSDALGLTEPELMGSVPLRQLQSPKPPAPAMYFRQASVEAVRKRQADPKKRTEPPLPALDLTEHVPNGRKHYLVHRIGDLSEHCPWETKKLKDVDTQVASKALDDCKRQGGRCGAPLAPGQQLWFHVDFENLTADELDLLCAAIDPGTCERAAGARSFRHRIGWGKPVGLGIVRITIEGRFLVDRGRRYSSSGLQEPRWHRHWLASTMTDDERDALSDR